MNTIGIVFLVGTAKFAFGVMGMTALLLMCLSYLFGLGLFASLKSQGVHWGRNRK